MNKDIKYIDWGIIEYSEALAKQEKMFNDAIALKLGGGNVDNALVMCEHQHVYTLGKSGNEGNMLINESALNALGAKLFHISRGGDITYHGPGQVVAYPIFDIEQYGIGLKEYIHRMEQSVIDVCAYYGIEAGRLEGATGVWLDAHTPQARKICAIGVQSSHYVTMHGLALNVNTDLKYFHYINPCGFRDKGVTSISQEKGCAIDMPEVKHLLFDAFKRNFS
jgi:lipoyl(octanoyl) transferase